MTRWWRMLVMVLSLLPYLSGTAQAQRLRITINSGAPVAFPTATEAHYDGASVPATAPVVFTLQLTGAGAGTLRTGIVSVRATGAFMGGTKPIGDLQWRRNDLGVWNSLTTSNVVIESRPMRRVPALNNPWSNSVLFRTLLSWANDGQATYTPTIVFTTTLTTP